MKNILPTLIISSIMYSLMTASTAVAGDGILGQKYNSSHYDKQAVQARQENNLGSDDNRIPELKDHEEPVNCGDILSEPGYYRLDSNLECTSSIQITSSYVFLNFHGYSLTCNPEEWEYPDPLGVPEEDRDFWVKGISVNYDFFVELPVVTNVHISNGTISNCHEGVLLLKADHSSLTRMTLRDNLVDSLDPALGAVIVDSHNNKILRNKVSGNTAGILLFGLTGNLLARNEVINNLLAGSVLLGGSGNTLMRNKTSNNLEEGILLLSSHGNRLINNQSNGNNYGMWLDYSNDNSISKNKMMENADTGMLLIGESNGNRIVENQADNNILGGISLIGVTVAGDSVGVPIPADNFIKDNSAFGNPSSDMAEAYLDFSDFDFIDFEIVLGDQCYNTWNNNNYDNALAIAGCIN